MSFIQNFWPQDNNYKATLDKLDVRLQQSVSENEHITSFLSGRIATEEQYGRTMRELAEKKRSLLSRPTVFDSSLDDGASLSHAFNALKDESTQIGHEHLKLADNIKESVLKPLEAATKEHQLKYSKHREIILTQVNLFEKSKSIVEIAQRNYIEKCQTADKLEEEAISVAQKKEEANLHVRRGSVTYIFGKLSLSEPDLKAFLIKAQSEGTSQDSRSMFLGLFRGLQSGEAIVQWLLHTYSNELKTPADAAEVGQALIDQNFLRLIGPGSQFKLASTAFYQWKKRADEYDDGEPPHYQARKVAGEADNHYQNAVKKCDNMRTKLEETTHTYLLEMEKNEEDRIETIKKAFTSLSEIETRLSSNVSTITSQIQPHLDSLKPQQDVALMAETLAVGSFRPRVILYQNYYHGYGIEQRFGVPLDFMARAAKVAVPPTVALLLEALDKVSEGQPEKGKLSIWCCSSTLEEIHRCRTSINHSNATLNDLFGYEAGVLAATLRLYLNELPDSLIPSFIYDKLKTICSEAADNKRCKALSECLAELSIPRRATIHSIMSLLKPMVSELDQKSPEFSQLVLLYSYCFMRPPENHAVGSFHHRHPLRVFKDILLSDNVIPATDPNEVAEWLSTPVSDSFTKDNPVPPSDVIFINTDDGISSPPNELTNEDQTVDKETNHVKNEPQNVEEVLSTSEKSNLPAETHDDDYLDLDLEDLGDAGVGGSNTDDPVDLKDDFFDDV